MKNKISLFFVFSIFIITTLISNVYCQNSSVVTCTYTINGSPLSGYKLWKGVGSPGNEYYHITVQISSAPPAPWTLYLMKPNGTYVQQNNNLSGTTYTAHISIAANDNAFQSGNGYYLRIVAPQGPLPTPANSFCDSPTFYISDLPQLTLTLITPTPLIVGSTGNQVSWSVSGGIPGLPNGGWTGNIRLQWHQDTPLQNFTNEIPVSQGSTTFTVPEFANLPGSNFKISGSNADVGTSIPAGYVSAFTSSFAINLPNPIENNSVIINNNTCALTCNSVPGLQNYKFVITFDPLTSKDAPGNFNNNSLIKYSANNYFLLTSSDLSNFTAAKYSYQAFNNNNSTPIGAGKLFAKINIEVPSDNSKQPLLMVHGWQSDGSIWNTLKQELNNTISSYILDYPNTGDIKESAYLLKNAIQYVLQKNTSSFTKVSILAHSMGGLVTRAYTVNKGRNLTGGVINYGNDINYAAFLGTPNKGGKFVEIFSISPFFTHQPQIAIDQLNPNGPFLRELNLETMNSSIKYLAIGGTDNNYLHLLYSWASGSNRDVTLNALIALIALFDRSDCVVSLTSAISKNNGFYSQYKVVNRNHLNYYKSEPSFSINTIKGYLQDFFPDGTIQSDDYSAMTFRSIAGETSIKQSNVNSVSGNVLSGVVVKLFIEGQSDPYVSISDKNGKYFFDNLPVGNYKIVYSSNGINSDSNYIRVSDSIPQITFNKKLERNPNFLGPTNCSITINSGSPFTNNLNVNLNLFAENATHMMISTDIDFNNSQWQPYAININFQFTDTSAGIKPIFVKFKNQLESDIVFSCINYFNSPQAQLNITSNPSNAKIIINGIQTNLFTPSVLTVPYGDYNVSVNKNGFSSSPNFNYINVNSSQVYNSFFNFQNAPPLPPKSFLVENIQDTIKLDFETSSDFDLMKTKINYRTDGIYPINQNDGINIFNNNTLPDLNYKINAPGLLHNITYYFSAFSIDSAGTYSTPKNYALSYLTNIFLNNNVIPTVSKLYSNYPNPFNPNTRIVFDLSKKGFVTLTLYDISGRELMKLINKEMEPGSYHLDFNSGSLSSGIYYYKLTSDNFVQTNKMVLTK